MFIEVRRERFWGWESNGRNFLGWESPRAAQRQQREEDGYRVVTCTHPAVSGCPGILGLLVQMLP